MRLHLPTACLALALAATGLTVPFATGAAAASPVEKLFVTGDLALTHDRLSGLYTELTPSSAPTAVVAESARVHVRDVSGSADGTRVIYVQDTLSSTGARLSSKVVVRDVSTRVVRVLMHLPAPGGRGFSDAVLSANGVNAAWVLYDAGTVRLVTASVSTGKIVTMRYDKVPHAFLDNDAILVRDLQGNASVMTVGGSEGTIRGLPKQARHAAVSVGHERIAWSRLETSNTPRKASLQVAPLLAPADGSGSWTVGAPVTLSNTAYDDQPSFTPDSTRLYWVRSSGVTGGPADVWSAPVDLSAPAAAAARTGGVETDVSVVRTDDGTSPGALQDIRGHLKGATPGLSWTAPADADLSGTVVVRRLSGVAQRAVFVPGTCESPPYCFQAFEDSGLVLGKTYEYTLAPVDRSNHYGPEMTRNLTAAAADVYFTIPTSTSSATASFPVTFGPVEAPGVRFTVAVDRQTWLQDVPSRSRTYPGAPGGVYKFDVTVKDAYGNTGDGHRYPAMVPRDQSIATFTGGANAYTADAFLGSYRKLWRPGDLARVALWGSKVRIVGATCPTCGAFDLYDHGKWIKRIDTYSPVTRLRRVVYTWNFDFADPAEVFDHAYTIKPVATGSRRDVILDGFAVS